MHFNRNAIIYRGPSAIDGSPIVAALSGVRHPSINRKTGPMLQAYILVDGKTPHEAIVDGSDSAICGSCALRSSTGAIGRACYVTWWQGPTNVHKAIARGKYEDVQSQLAVFAATLRGRALRIGAYGDPAAVPFRVWFQLLAGGIARWTAYTHQWRDCPSAFKAIAMASVDNAREQHEAETRGWRTFRLRRHGDDLLAGEFVCPASDEGKHRATCLSCNLCRGASSPARNVAILPHGQRAGWVS